MGRSASDDGPDHTLPGQANRPGELDPARVQAESGRDKGGACHAAPRCHASSNRTDWLLRERLHRMFIDDVKRGLADITAGRTEDADIAIARLQQRRAEIATRAIGDRSLDS